MDDILVGAKSQETIDNIVKALNQKLNVHVFGKFSKFLRMNIYYDKKEVSIQQKEAITAIARDFNRFQRYKRS